MTAVASPQTQFAATASKDRQQQLTALLAGVGVATMDDTGWLRITGEDRVRWLNGMTTNSIQELQPGQGNYNFFLNAQGRIHGDGYAFAQPDSILLETDHSRLPALMQLLDRFIIMDDVELADASGDRFGLLCAGPDALRTLKAVGLEFAGTGELRLVDGVWRGQPVTVLHGYSPIVPRIEIWADTAAIAEELTGVLAAAGAIVCGAQALQELRILEGTPLYGVDIRDRELPQETGQTRALHFAKGCYLGQEIVERIRSRGNVHRTFQAFELSGSLPATGSVLESAAKPVGELTSVAAIPLASGIRQLALGYIRREALEASRVGSHPVTYFGGQAVPVASPYQLQEKRSNA